MPNLEDIRAYRVHEILAARRNQLDRNLLVKDGGKPYIDSRLHRFPSESEASWTGTQNGVVSRPDRAFLINYAARIWSKLNQYVFSQPIVREGIDEDFAKDASRTGLSINQLMQNLSADYTVGQWAWIGVDRASPAIDPDTGQRTSRSVAQREAEGDRVFWSIWDSTEVVDWRFAADGTLERIITQHVEYNNSDLMAAPSNRVIRTIWEPGQVTVLTLKKDKPKEVATQDVIRFPAQVVPFVLIGVPSKKAYWFDDVELVQASLLNLDSAHHENLIKAVFPQLVVPAGLIEEIMTLSEKGFREALELVRGIEYPLLEPTDAKGITRLITPAASDLKAIPDEILRRRRELMDIVGLAMSKTDSNAAQSAASKAWDHLDPSATLAARSQLLEETETKAVAISRELDSSFPEYQPVYPRQFNLPNVAEDIKVLLELGNMTLPPEGHKQVARVAVEILDSMFKIDAERKAAILAEVDAMEAPDFASISAAIAGDDPGGGGFLPTEN